jgi:predicted  nucleic acid-binding Zn-ribbon protein
MTSKSLTLEVPKNEAAKIEATLKEFAAQMERGLKRMKNDQVEIEKLKAQTRAMLAELKAA